MSSRRSRRCRIRRTRSTSAGQRCHCVCASGGPSGPRRPGDRTGSRDEGRHMRATWVPVRTSSTYDAANPVPLLRERYFPCGGPDPNHAHAAAGSTPRGVVDNFAGSEPPEPSPSLAHTMSVRGVGGCQSLGITRAKARIGDLLGKAKVGTNQFRKLARVGQPPTPQTCGCVRATGAGFGRPGFARACPNCPLLDSCPDWRGCQGPSSKLQIAVTPRTHARFGVRMRAR